MTAATTATTARPDRSGGRLRPPPLGPVRRTRILRWLLPVASVLAGVGVWQAYAMGQPAYLFPAVDTIGRAFIDQLGEGLVGHALGSLRTLAIGFVLAMVVGLAVGTLMAASRWADIVLTPYVNGLYVAPKAALAPVIVLVGGAGELARIFVVFLFVVFDITINTYQGAKLVPQGLLEAARSFGASRSFQVFRVRLPYAMPLIFAGLRLGIGHGVKGVILAELLFEYANLGLMIEDWYSTYRVAGVLSIAVLLMAMGLLLTWLMGKLQDRVLTWQPRAKV